MLLFIIAGEPNIVSISAILNPPPIKHLIALVSITDILDDANIIQCRAHNFSICS